MPPDGVFNDQYSNVLLSRVKLHLRCLHGRLLYFAGTGFILFFLRKYSHTVINSSN